MELIVGHFHLFANFALKLHVTDILQLQNGMLLLAGSLLQQMDKVITGEDLDPRAYKEMIIQFERNYYSI